MPRIYLNILFFFFCLQLSAQGTREDFIAFARQQKEKGDYIAAINYFDKALAIDSEDVHVLWDYAECLRLYKDYRNAERIYQKVYDKEETGMHLRSLFYLGEMQKYNGKYEEAVETFKKAKKKYVKDKNGYLYLKSKQELEACLWAKKALKDTAVIVFESVPAVNTVDSEFGHTFYEDKLFFSSLRADSSNREDEIFSPEYRHGIYHIDRSLGEKAQRQQDLHSATLHAGNGTFSLDKKRFYYSLCKEKDEGLSCKIMVAWYVNGNMRSVDTLGEIINEEDANTTMPSIARFDGGEVLFFASDRVGSKGGLDLFYSYITDGTQFSKPLPVEDVNTPDNELSPFFDSISQTLYFSSSWHYGFGGYDVFSSRVENGRFQKAENLGLPVNSQANDLYYFIHEDTSYLSSNRLGVNYTNNPTCCSDIFRYTVPEPKQDSVPVAFEEEIKMTFAELNKKLPVTLYFHNDIPNPRSKDTTTQVNYIDSYKDYIGMIPQYKREYSKGLTGDKAVDAQEDIESFFTEYVEQGVKDLEVFRELLLEELEKGHSIVLTVKGFASPLAKTDYNVNLTKRRIASLANYLGRYDKGQFLPYLKGTHPNGTVLQIQEVPFGEYTADKAISDNPNDLKNSIYSRVAALERKIEIQSVSFLNRDSVNYLTTPEQLKDLGKIDPAKSYTIVFEIENSGKNPLDIEQIEIPCSCNTAEISAMHFEPGAKGTVKVTLDPKGYSGKLVKSVYLHVKGSSETLRLVLTGEIK